jgi:hypothetical protein
LGANGGIPRSTNILRHTIFDYVGRTTFPESHIEMKGWGNEIDVLTDGLGDRVRGARDVWMASVMIINMVFGVQKILGVSNGQVHDDGLRLIRINAIEKSQGRRYTNALDFAVDALEPGVHEPVHNSCHGVLCGSEKIDHLIGGVMFAKVLGLGR